jgi:hypothetical protein
MHLFDKPRKKNILQILPKFYFLLLLLKKCNMEKHYIQGKIKPDDANTEKQSLDLLFLSSPINTCKDLQNIRGKNKVPLVPRLLIKCNSKISNQT